MGLWLTAKERNNMDKAIMTEVENLRRAGVTSLRKRYRELFQEEARSRHREHLFRKIVWRLQALAEGQLSERARARAREIANNADLRMLAPHSFFSVGGESVEIIPRDQSKKINDPRLPMVGTILRRSWKGRTILVEVLAKGFRYENRHELLVNGHQAIRVTTCRPDGYSCLRGSSDTSFPGQVRPGATVWISSIRASGVGGLPQVDQRITVVMKFSKGVAVPRLFR